jgi:hypothetical protein
MGAFNAALFILQVLPGLILGAQQLHAGQAGETKKQQVMDWIGFGTAAGAGVATGVTGNQVVGQQISGIGALAAEGVKDVSGIIDSIVSLFHKNNVQGFGASRLAVVAKQEFTVTGGGSATVTQTDNAPAK